MAKQPAVAVDDRCVMSVLVSVHTTDDRRERRSRPTGGSRQRLAHCRRCVTRSPAHTVPIRWVTLSLGRLDGMGPAVSTATWRTHAQASR